MRLGVEILTGTLFYIHLKEDATVADLKRAIEAQEKLPCERLILVLNGNVMTYMVTENEAPLMKYGVQDGSHLYLFLSPQDAPPPHFLLGPPDCTWSHASPLMGSLYQQSE